MNVQLGGGLVTETDIGTIVHQNQVKTALNLTRPTPA